jgi:hypothetical protein
MVCIQIFSFSRNGWLQLTCANNESEENHTMPELNTIHRSTPGVSSQSVGLGCGTLLVIALIVIFFGRTDIKPLEAEIVALRGEVSALHGEVTRAREMLEIIATRIDGNPAAAGPDAPR